MEKLTLTLFNPNQTQNIPKAFFSNAINTFECAIENNNMIIIYVNSKVDALYPLFKNQKVSIDLLIYFINSIFQKEYEGKYYIDT